ncbi:hypothetical protein HU200_055457 [Digitaria exilis]|uniref:At2g35280-like TPR domain-containing protein n=1 Tax=Digitaria exilis TaxID=1010633 RepID=A0A835AI64_9POAL|nr:hypothetical protein HU200_055457 [Digitaria exilis]
MATRSASSSPSLVHALPHDMAVEIAGHVAATSPLPMEDLRSLRASCQAMRAACSNRDVGRRVALEREAAAMRWADHDRYLAVVGILSGAGNPKACFLAGIALIFVHRSAHQGAELLGRAAMAGHKVAAYVLGVLLYTYNTDNAVDDVARRHMRQVEGDEEVVSGDDDVAIAKISNSECVRCRAQAVEAVSQATWKMAPELPKTTTVSNMVTPEEDASHRCEVSGCGAREAWSDSAVFCSEECRIRYECAMFISQLPLTVANFAA